MPWARASRQCRCASTPAQSMQGHAPSDHGACSCQHLLTMGHALCSEPAAACPMVLLQLLAPSGTSYCSCRLAPPRMIVLQDHARAAAESSTIIIMMMMFGKRLQDLQVVVRCSVHGQPAMVESDWTRHCAVPRSWLRCTRPGSAARPSSSTTWSSPTNPPGGATISNSIAQIHPSRSCASTPPMCCRQ